jgi:hypothetical protein
MGRERHAPVLFPGPPLDPHVHARARARTRTHACARARARTHTHSPAHARTHTHARTCKHMHACTRTRRARPHTRPHTRPRKRRRTCPHKRDTHTHKRNDAESSTSIRARLAPQRSGLQHATPLLRRSAACCNTAQHGVTQHVSNAVCCSMACCKVAQLVATQLVATQLVAAPECSASRTQDAAMPNSATRCDAMRLGFGLHRSAIRCNRGQHVATQDDMLQRRTHAADNVL